MAVRDAGVVLHARPNTGHGVNPAQGARRSSCPSRLNPEPNRAILSRYPCGRGGSPWVETGL